jgi:hypothetical protein
MVPAPAARAIATPQTAEGRCRTDKRPCHATDMGPLAYRRTPQGSYPQSQRRGSEVFITRPPASRTHRQSLLSAYLGAFPVKQPQVRPPLRCREPMSRSYCTKTWLRGSLRRYSALQGARWTGLRVLAVLRDWRCGWCYGPAGIEGIGVDSRPCGEVASPQSLFYSSAYGAAAFTLVTTPITKNCFPRRPLLLPIRSAQGPAWLYRLPRDRFTRLSEHSTVLP